MITPDFLNTERFIHSRRSDPEQYVKDSFRTIRLASGIRAITGVRQGETQTSIQSVLFDREQFNADAADRWLRRNEKRMMEALEIERKKEELFDEVTLEDLVMEVGELRARLEMLEAALVPKEETSYRNKFGELR